MIRGCLLAAALCPFLLWGCATLSSNPKSLGLEKQAYEAYASGRLSEAEGLYLELTRIRSGAVEPWFRLGNIYAESGRLEAAERAYRTALSYGDEPRVLHNLGLVQIRLGIKFLKESRRQLPVNDSIRRQTQQYLRTLLQEAL
jgi:tetratricopeptide (TPR) repeat protein